VNAWLQPIQEFFSWLLASRELFAAFIGALVGGAFAVLAQMLASNAQRKRDRQTERATLRGTLEAIATELEVFKTHFLDGFEDMFSEPKPGTSKEHHLREVAPLHQKLSIVFDSNAAVLGRLPDASLRRKIVATYVKLKATIDVVNEYAERRKNSVTASLQPSPGGGLLGIRGDVEQWAGNVRRFVPILQKEIDELLDGITNYLKTYPK